MKEEIKAVVFDVNGVLLLGEGRSFHQYVSKQLKIDLETWFDSIDQYWSNFVSGLITEEKFLLKISQSINKSPRRIKRAISRAFNKRFKENKWLFKQLFILNQLGYKTGILSDQVPISYELFEKKYKLSSRVKFPIWSNKVKCRKPNLAIYKLCIERIKENPSEILFIDNREWNLIPAEELGMRTILFKDNKKLKKDKTWRTLFK